MNIYHKIVGFRNRFRYWSNSALSYWIQEKVGMEKSPPAASSKEWRELGERQQKVSPTIYWITEEGFDIVQDILYFPYDVYRNINRYVVNRFIDRPHLIDTKLKPGQWHESDTRILHGLCELVVDFVEGEKAHMNDLGSWDEEDTKPKIKDRREAGLTYLDWEISLIKDDDYFGIKNDDPEFGKPTPQSIDAQEIKDIYLWWKDVRPSRPDPHDVSGWSEYCTHKRDMFDPEEDEDRQKQVRVMLDVCAKLEQEYDDEDTEMLIRIIKIRKGMWT